MALGERPSHDKVGRPEDEDDERQPEPHSPAQPAGPAQVLGLVQHGAEDLRDPGRAEEMDEGALPSVGTPVRRQVADQPEVDLESDARRNRRDGGPYDGNPASGGHWPIVAGSREGRKRGVGR